MDKLIKENIYSLFAFLAQKSISENHIGEKVSWVKTEKFAWPNFVYNLAVDSDDQELLIENLNNDIVNKIAPPLLLIQNEDKRESIFNLLESKDIRPVTKWVGMALDLDILEPKENIENFEVIKVKTEEELEKYCSLSSKVLFNNSNLSKELFLPVLSDDKIALFLGLYNGVPAATSMVYMHQTAGIYMISTAPEFRKLGLGSFITYVALKHAKNLGISKSVLHSTPMGYKMYKSLKFKEYQGFDILWKVGKNYKI